FGLPGVLTSRSNQGVKTPLRLFGPPGLKTYIELTLELSGSHLGYELIIQGQNEAAAATDEPIYEDGQFRVYCGALEHRIACLGYRVEEKDRPGRLDVERLAADGVPPGPHYGRLKNGEDITLADGTVIHADKY